MLFTYIYIKYNGIIIVNKHKINFEKLIRFAYTIHIIREYNYVSFSKCSPLN